MSKYESTKCYNLIKKYFNGDGKKATLWFITYNPPLACKPVDMLRKGKGKNLLKYIESCINGYFP